MWFFPSFWVPNLAAAELTAGRRLLSELSIRRTDRQRGRQADAIGWVSHPSFSLLTLMHAGTNTPQGTQHTAVSHEIASHTRGNARNAPTHTRGGRAGSLVRVVLKTLIHLACLLPLAAH